MTTPGNHPSLYLAILKALATADLGWADSVHVYADRESLSYRIKVARGDVWTMICVTPDVMWETFRPVRAIRRQLDQAGADLAPSRPRHEPARANGGH